MAREIARLGAGVAAVLVSVAGAANAHADPLPVRPPGAPQYIDHVVWEQHGERSTLRIYPTPWGWSASGVFTNGAQSYDAWAELLQHAPEANTLSMQKQFLCYWQLSTFTNPGKVGTWNLEPWRTVVPNTLMLNAGCNPGGAEDVAIGT
ncbi:DUF2599 domain-containing protein [Mycolicibacterium parafortuitum]|uniref:Aldehyde dehydrogenase n=1 Tax=Mycolicibacterium parafortuitum TaxID=39692 RepID=A0A375YIL0_MYCPF|nr:DUF2599 domain-containing protein [Mycolicibacterium parafortuitum]ORB32277.1 aldehyde dehydrogenase [Mycolicibacterium parafortuitum]SRX80962.1 hypothetical protein MPP7335_02708 [Mycolicibacterium parafortuitum]